MSDFNKNNTRGQKKTGEKKKGIGRFCPRLTRGHVNPEPTLELDPYEVEELSLEMGGMSIEQAPTPAGMAGGEQNNGVDDTDTDESEGKVTIRPLSDAGRSAVRRFRQQQAQQQASPTREQRRQQHQQQQPRRPLHTPPSPAQLCYVCGAHFTMYDAGDDAYYCAVHCQQEPESSESEEEPVPVTVPVPEPTMFAQLQQQLLEQQQQQQQQFMEQMQKFYLQQQQQQQQVAYPACSPHQSLNGDSVTPMSTPTIAPTVVDEMPVTNWTAMRQRIVLRNCLAKCTTGANAGHQCSFRSKAGHIYCGVHATRLLEEDQRLTDQEFCEYFGDYERKGTPQSLMVPLPKRRQRKP